MSAENKITPVHALMRFEQKRDALIDADEAERNRKEKFYQGVAICSEAVKHAGSFGTYFFIAYYPLTHGTDFGEWTRAIAAVSFATLAQKGTEAAQNKLGEIKSNRRIHAINEASKEMKEELDPGLNDLIRHIATGELIDARYWNIKD